METRRYCVYNQTNECFLSLGVTAGEKVFTLRRGFFSKGQIRSSEGKWILRPLRIRTVGLLSERDLIYLDHAQRVVHMVERLPSLKLAQVHPDVSSVLVLPVSTIESSQTQVGNQLVICVTEEMQFRLRPSEPAPHFDNAIQSDLPAAEPPESDRRIAPRTRWPHLIAFDSEGEPVDLHGIRDISTTGLYLMTEERWPVGSQVRMSLQRTDHLDDLSMIPITMDLRVSRWGEDGVGLEFLRADVEHSALVAMHVR